MTICAGYVFSSDIAFLTLLTIPQQFPHVQEALGSLNIEDPWRTLFVGILVGQRHLIQFYSKILCNVHEQKFSPLEQVSY